MERHTQIIAEVSSNHGGDLMLAKEFVRIAAQVGVDYVKFQSWQVSHLKNPADFQREWLDRAELTDEAHVVLLEECQKRGIKFLTTIFSAQRAPFLLSLGLKEIKVGSGETNNTALLRAIKGKFQHIIVSTGLHYSQEVEEAADILRGTSFTFMHCVSIYPSPLDKVNLERMEWLKRFTPSVGFSDHCAGLEAAKVAIARGARYLERHFCLGKYGPGRVNPWDTTPEQFEELVKYAEQTAMALGQSDASMSAEELASRQRFLGRWTKGDTP